MRTATIFLALAVTPLVSAAQTRLVLIDQDGSGPGGSDQMAIMALLEAPQVKVLGITMVTGDAWRDEETLHTLRMLELTGHADVPVARGAVFPLIRTQQETRLAEALNGRQTYLGAWRQEPAKSSADCSVPSSPGAPWQHTTAASTSSGRSLRSAPPSPTNPPPGPTTRRSGRAFRGTPSAKSRPSSEASTSNHSPALDQ